MGLIRFPSDFGKAEGGWKGKRRSSSLPTPTPLRPPPSSFHPLPSTLLLLPSSLFPLLSAKSSAFRPLPFKTLLLSGLLTPSLYSLALQFTLPDLNSYSERRDVFGAEIWRGIGVWLEDGPSAQFRSGALFSFSTTPSFISAHTSTNFSPTPTFFRHSVCQKGLTPTLTVSNYSPLATSKSIWFTPSLSSKTLRRVWWKKREQTRVMLGCW